MTSTVKISGIDALIIGCGLTGSVIARHLAEEGKKVLILERRDHIGGNMYDYPEEHGILIQKYGPHIFETNNIDLYNYMRRFEDWHERVITTGAVIKNKCVPLPFNFKSIDTFYSPDDAAKLKARLRAAFPERDSATILELLEHSDDDIRSYADFLFENDYKPYTVKMWDIPPEGMDKSVLRRVPVRFSYLEGCFDAKYQAVPVHSFTRFFENLLAHENIHVELGVNALEHLSINNDTLIFDGTPLTMPVVYTGALDEFFGNKFGSLPYRSLRFELKYSDEPNPYPDPIVYFPQDNTYTRITEYKHFLSQDKQGNLYSIEYPLNYGGGGGMSRITPCLQNRA